MLMLLLVVVYDNTFTVGCNSKTIINSLIFFKI